MRRAGASHGRRTPSSAAASQGGVRAATHTARNSAGNDREQYITCAGGPSSAPKCVNWKPGWCQTDDVKVYGTVLLLLGEVHCAADRVYCTAAVHHRHLQVYFNAAAHFRYRSTLTTSAVGCCRVAVALFVSLGLNHPHPPDTYSCQRRWRARARSRAVPA